MGFFYVSFQIVNPGEAGRAIGARVRFAAGVGLDVPVVLGGQQFPTVGALSGNDANDVFGLQVTATLRPTQIKVPQAG